MKALAAFTMRSRFSAVPVAAATALLFWLFPPFLMVSGAAITLVTLRYGAVEGMMVVALTAAVATGLMGTMLNAWLPMLQVLAGYYLPLWGLALVLRATISLSRALQAAAVLSVLGVILFYLILGDPAAWWGSMLSELRQNITVSASTGQAADRDAVEQLLILMEGWVPYLPGQIVSVITLFVLGALFLGRWWQALLFNPGGFRSEFHQLQLGRSLAVLTLVLFGVALVSGWASLANVALALGTLYTIQGLALIHAAFFKWQLSSGWLLLLYLVLVPLSSQFIMALGIADAWADFRSRIRSRPD